MKHGFVQSWLGNSLFTKGSGKDLAILLVYVDDSTCPNFALIQQAKDTLEENFKLKVIGDLHCFLGLEIAKSSKKTFVCANILTPTLEWHRLPRLQTCTNTMDFNILLNDTNGDPFSQPFSIPCVGWVSLYSSPSRAYTLSLYLVGSAIHEQTQNTTFTLIQSPPPIS